MEIYSEVRSDFYDDIKQATAIDAWKTDDDNEEGSVVALVYDDGRVEWNEPEAQNSDMVKAEIEAVLADINLN